MASNGHVNGHLPDLGAVTRLGERPRIGTNFNALVRRLDPMGTFEAADVVVGPQGPLAVAARSQYLDAEELLAAVRQIVREEIAAALEKRSD